MKNIWIETLEFLYKEYERVKGYLKEVIGVVLGFEDVLKVLNKTFEGIYYEGSYLEIRFSFEGNTYKILIGDQIESYGDLVTFVERYFSENKNINEFLTVKYKIFEDLTKIEEFINEILSVDKIEEHSEVNLSKLDIVAKEMKKVIEKFITENLKLRYVGIKVDVVHKEEKDKGWVKIVLTLELKKDVFGKIIYDIYQYVGFTKLEWEVVEDRSDKFLIVIEKTLVYYNRNEEGRILDAHFYYLDEDYFVDKQYREGVIDFVFRFNRLLDELV